MKNIIISAFLFLLPLTASAQKITLGSMNITMDNTHGVYKGEMAAGKPHGKGNVVFKSLTLILSQTLCKNTSAPHIVVRLCPMLSDF